VASAIVSEKHGGTVATVLRTRISHWKRAGKPLDAMIKYDKLTAEEVSNFVSSSGYTLWPQQVKFVETYEEMAVPTHSRTVLLDLLRACFSDADVDGDGSITLAELKEFLMRHEIDLPEEQKFFEVLEMDKAKRTEGGGADYTLEFEEFKSFLLQTRLLALQDNNHDGKVEEFGIDQHLHRILARSLFKKADTDGDGSISLDEIKQVLKHYGFEASSAESVFKKYDANGSGGIDETEFSGFLVEEGIVRAVEKPTSEQVADKINKTAEKCTIL
jgi:Ca2+-binding EF-hand superfamily protein